LTYYPESK